MITNYILTHPKRRLCGAPDWNYIIRYAGHCGKTQELKLIGIDSVTVHELIAQTIRNSCGFSRVESIHLTPATADFVKKDYPLKISYFENLY